MASTLAFVISGGFCTDTKYRNPSMPKSAAHTPNAIQELFFIVDLSSNAAANRSFADLA
jgi:hypothetical protein